MECSGDGVCVKRAGDDPSQYRITARDASYYEGLPERSSDHISAVTQITAQEITQPVGMK